MGTTTEFDLDLVVPDTSRSLADGTIAAWRNQGRRLNAIYAETLERFCKQFDVLADIPFRNIPEPLRNILMNGTSGAEHKQYAADFEGVLPNLRKRWETTQSESAKQRLHAFIGESPCERCGGTRLTEQALCVRIGGVNIADVLRMTITTAAVFFDKLTLTAPLAKQQRRGNGHGCMLSANAVSVPGLWRHRSSVPLAWGYRIIPAAIR